MSRALAAGVLAMSTVHQQASEEDTDMTPHTTPAPAPSPARAEPTGRPRASRQPRRRADERAEGVISTAIAVLIVAFLGIALWTGFDAMMNSATERTRAQVEQIGG